MDAKVVSDLSEALISAVAIMGRDAAEQAEALDRVRELVSDDGADVNHIHDEGGWTVLIMSLQTRHLEVL
eukprot:scaffold1708_cov61-Attheya_sp.AAC.3